MATTDSFCPSKIIICGFGSMGSQYAEIIHEAWPTTLISLLRSSRSNDICEPKYICNSFSAIDVALDWQPELAIIATPAHTHLNFALAFARSGIPLLIEKPIGMPYESESDWNEILALSRKLPISVGYVLRYDPCVQFIKDILHSNKFGEVLEADFYCGSWLPAWRPKYDYRRSVSASSQKGGGALMELSHELDMAYYLLGSYEIIFAYLSNTQSLEINAEDVAYLTALHGNKRVLQFRLNFCTSPPRRYVLLRSSSSELHWDLLARRVTFTSDKMASPQIFSTDVLRRDRLRLQLADIFRCINNPLCNPLCSAQDALFSLRSISKAFDLANPS